MKGVMDRLVVHTDGGKKGKSFEVGLLGYIVLDSSGAYRETIRPVWMAYAESEDAVKPFTANVRMGAKLLVPDRNPGDLSSGTAFEFLRSGGFQYSVQRMPDGYSAVTVFEPEIFVLNPGMIDPTRIEFLVAPPTFWIHAHGTKFQNAEAVSRYVQGLNLPDVPRGELTRLVPLASLFCGYLDHRSRVPLVQDPRFQLQLLVRCLSVGMARFAAPSRRGYGYGQETPDWGVSSGDIVGHNLSQAGLFCALRFVAPHDKFGDLVAEEVARYFRSIPKA